MSCSNSAVAMRRKSPLYCAIGVYSSCSTSIRRQYNWRWISHSRSSLANSRTACGSSDPMPLGRPLGRTSHSAEAQNVRSSRLSASCDGQSSSSTTWTSASFTISRSVWYMNTPPPCTGGRMGYGETNSTRGRSGAGSMAAKRSRKYPPSGRLKASLSVMAARPSARRRDRMAWGSCRKARHSAARFGRSGISPNTTARTAPAQAKKKCAARRGHS